MALFSKSILKPKLIFSYSDNFDMVPQGTEKMMKIRMKQTERKSTRKYDCDEFNHAKYTKCIELFIVEQLQCKPAWIYVSDNMIPLCRGSEKYKMFLALIKDLSKANCIVPNCKEMIWESQEMWTTDTLSQWNTNGTIIQYFALTKTVKVSEEVFTYGVFDVFNDFAGVLSLFLGVSIISFYDYIVETSKTIFDKFKMK